MIVDKFITMNIYLFKYLFTEVHLFVGFQVLITRHAMY